LAATVTVSIDHLGTERRDSGRETEARASFTDCEA
jgi:hypothetical protein